MLLASENVSAQLRASHIPLLEGALECVRAGHIPGGLNANREFAECVVGYDEQVSEAMRSLLFDPQTAGGFLIAVSASHSAALSAALQSAGVHASEIGAIHSGSKPLITVLP
jgi:selenide,water dikinase